jgi:outer membrane murein-binding lipoprotein Lpp
MGTTTPRRATPSRAWVGALLVAGLGHTLVTHAADDSDRIAALEQKLDQSLQLIRQLSARVQDLEAQVAQGAPTVPAKRSGTGAAAAAPATAAAAQPATPAATQPGAAAATPPDTAQRLARVEQTVTEMAASAGQHAEDFGMPMHGFADVGVGNHNAEFRQYQGADIAELDFFLTPRLGSRTRALFELNFEVGSDGAVGVDLERAQIGYQFSDSATVWLGRFHTPYGYYNTAFHHGQQIATSLRRPRFIEFEDHGGIMPAHTVGAWLSGSQRLGDEKLTYDVYIGNSQRIKNGILDMNNAGNTQGSTIVGGNLGLLMSGALDGLKVGVDVFQTRILDEDAPPPAPATRVRSYGAYAAYDTDSWEDIGEFHVFDNDDLTGHTGTHRSEAGFVQMGYRAGRYTPYARYERGAFQQSDHFFAAQTNGSSYYRTALGLRFDVDLVSSLKLELAETHLTDRDIGSYDEALLQYAIRF